MQGFRMLNYDIDALPEGNHPAKGTPNLTVYIKRIEYELFSLV